MNQQQEPLQIGDTVEIQEDYREFLNGRQGKIFEIIGDVAHIEFNNCPAVDRYAVVRLTRLRRVEAKA